MTEANLQTIIAKYLEEITEQFYSGHAIEHAYRPALQTLMSSFEDTVAVNDPKHSEHGAPDFVFLKKSNTKIIKGYAEAKDITVSLDKTEKTNQMQRYGGYANLFLTDYLEFRFFKNGEKYQTISLGHVKDGKLYKTPENGEMLARELAAFLELPPEKIKSGRRLAEIMGGKARRIRDNVVQYLAEDDDKSTELLKIYEMMKKLLVHDLTEEKFADMYAQTLVYGLFVARYGDSTQESFDRSEARDLVPKSNPFLRHFFDHIVGPNFDVRLGYIVDELCEVFSVSNVQEIVHKHLRIQDETSDSKDPIIHFYEDFLHEYDPAERKRMGAYYTPIPVVKFIVRHVDKILKEEFGITKGLASDQTIDHWVETGQDMRADKRTKLKTGYNVKLPRVQVLDPAVGTATFLNETIKFIYEGFKGQEGRWPGYVNDNLVKRLHGFELMMAPYTIAHLKLGMTLKETGVENLKDRLGVYLTNTLEEGVPMQPDLFSFGLAEAVSDESRHAAEIKSERPVMVVMGNPPYSVSSNNKSKYIENLVADYKKDLNERNIQPLSDDYIKFIRFAEEMVAKNGSGIVAMITNNSYIDGLIHRQMRKHLLQTFDKIYVLDLHGNSKKKEVASDGGRDENVFDIQQGVGIIFAVKTGKKQPDTLADLFHDTVKGTRKYKFEYLDSHGNGSEFAFVQKPIAPRYAFGWENTLDASEYSKYVSVRELMPAGDVGVASYRDSFATDIEKDLLAQRMRDYYTAPTQDLVSKYGLKESKSFSIQERRQDAHFDETKIKKIQYRPFDSRWIYYSSDVADRLRPKTSKHMLKENLALSVLRNSRDAEVNDKVFVVDILADKSVTSSLDNAVVFPLYLHNEDGTRTQNFNPAELSALKRNLTAGSSPEDILDYIYAVLHSPAYRAKYKELLKIDFPRVPAPASDTEFTRLVVLGRQLRELHLMKSPFIANYDTTYPEAGSDEVEKISFATDITGGGQYATGSVYINETQYFGNVPEVAWNFYIGGYQPVQKWLKDRKGRKLSSNDLDHYQKIIKILIETDRIMKDIDNVAA
ncbi:MAG: type ISP restriction/modification enzyme [Patescibacteria group bacterium]